jgi:hypothetical protein
VERHPAARATDEGEPRGSHGRARLAPADDDGLAENEATLAEDNVPEQRVWRATWAHEEPDEEWTHKQSEEVKEKAKSLLAWGSLTVHSLSCRQTVCRMYLQFSDPKDAKAFISAAGDPAMHYEYQDLTPEVSRTDPSRPEYAYEVLITRPRPEYLAMRAPSKAEVSNGAGEAPEVVASAWSGAGEAEGLTAGLEEVGAVVFTPVSRRTSQPGPRLERERAHQR